ncbi:MAG: hypothetical protein HFJ53_01540 [Clostridia bacterium]|jgi:hypothetical protein|nr:hypothetical protein [Clostridia bacterium]
MKCLNFIEELFVLHCDEQGRYKSVKELFRKNTISVEISSCIALEIVNDKCRIVMAVLPSCNKSILTKVN